MNGSDTLPSSSSSLFPSPPLKLSTVCKYSGIVGSSSQFSVSVLPSLSSPGSFSKVLNKRKYCTESNTETSFTSEMCMTLCNRLSLNESPSWGKCTDLSDFSSGMTSRCSSPSSPMVDSEASGIRSPQRPKKNVGTKLAALFVLPRGNHVKIMVDPDDTFEQLMQELHEKFQFQFLDRMQIFVDGKPLHRHQTPQEACANHVGSPVFHLMLPI